MMRFAIERHVSRVIAPSLIIPALIPALRRVESQAKGQSDANRARELARHDPDKPLTRAAESLRFGALDDRCSQHLADQIIRFTPFRKRLPISRAVAGHARAGSRGNRFDRPRPREPATRVSSRCLSRRCCRRLAPMHVPAHMATLGTAAFSRASGCEIERFPCFFRRVGARASLLPRYCGHTRIARPSPRFSLSPALLNFTGFLGHVDRRGIVPRAENIDSARKRTREPARWTASCRLCVGSRGKPLPASSRHRAALNFRRLAIEITQNART